jgi:deoxyribonuclease (pyrimidine dimer)
MTRINLVDPDVLTKVHLVAEYKELTQFLHLVRKRIDNNHPMDDLPKEYCLNGGHCKFFYDKGEYLYDRYKSLYREMNRRNLNVNKEKYRTNLDRIKNSYNKALFNAYTPSPTAISIAVQRIRERIIQKPHLYPDKDRFMKSRYT